MMRLLIATVVAVALALPASAAAPDVLSHLIRARGTSAYRGEQMIATWDGTQTQTTLVRIEHDPPGWTRMEYIPMGSQARRIVLRRETVEIQYDPDSRLGTRRNRLPAELDDDLETTHLTWLRENYRLTIAPAEQLGREAERIDLRPKIFDRPARRMYVDAATGVVLRSERMTADGRLGEVSAFIAFEIMPRGWRVNVASPKGLRLAVEPNDRAVTPDEVAQMAGQPPVRFVPPEGFHLLGLFAVGGRPSVFQSVYSDGLSVLVLTQRPGEAARAPQGSRVVNAGSGPVWLHSMGLRTLAHWASSGWLLTLVGDVSPDRMIEVAQQTGVAQPPRLVDRLIAWLQRLRLRIAQGTP